MTHIVLATTELHPLNTGGAGVFVDAAARELAEAGFRVTILADVPVDAVRRYPGSAALGIRVRALAEFAPADEWYADRFPAPVRALAERTAVALARLAAEDPFDVVEFQDFGGLGTVALLDRARSRRLADVACLVRVHGPLELLGLANPGRRASMYALALHAFERLAFSLCDAVLAPSAGLADLISDAYGVPESRVTVSAPPLRKILTLVPHGPAAGDSLLFVGKLNSVKGADLFVAAAVEAMRLTPEDAMWQAILVGRNLPSDTVPGVLEGDRLRRLIPPHLAERFVFLDHVPRGRIADLAAGSFAAAVPSRFESFCLVAHELRSLHVPLVLARLPAFSDGFEHESSCLLTDGTPGDFARQIIRLRRDDGLRARLAATAAPDPGEFSEAYAKLLSALSPGAAVTPQARSLLHTFDDVVSLHGIAGQTL